MKKSYKIFISIIIFVMIFGFFSWEKFYKNFAILTNFDKNLPENRYNQALELSQNNQFKEALTLLPDNMELFPERLFELRGDILYAEKALSGAIIAEYERSLGMLENERIREKIRLISLGDVTNEDSEKEDQKVQKPEEIQEAEARIEADQANRAEFINSYNASKNLRKDVEDIKNLLESDRFSERRDW